MSLRTIQLTLAAIAAFTLSSFAQDNMAPDQVPLDLSGSMHGSHETVTPHDHTNGQAHARWGINGIDSVPNFNGHFMTPGYDSAGNPQKEWYYNIIGNPPQLGGTTTLNAPIVPVVVQLLDFDGSIRLNKGKQMILDPSGLVQNVLGSPVFSNTSFDDSPVATQVTDAVQRAEFDKKAKSDWHTMLQPSVKTTRTISLPRGTYQFAAFADGTVAYVLVNEGTFIQKLFPTAQTDTTTPVGAAENAGDINTKSVSTFLFNNVYLFSGNNCCVLGFHSYDVEPGDASNGNKERRYVVNYSSWILPGLFGGGFQDVTALSHEIAESFNDPFVASDGVHDATPFWLSPNGNCQNNLEDGDVIEGLPNSVYPITMNGYTYHPQNEALLQWFEFQTNSDAFNGAYSYPNINTLTQLSPANLKPGCVQ
jgi:hypothetical protein